MLENTIIFVGGLFWKQLNWLQKNTIFQKNITKMCWKYEKEVRFSEKNYFLFKKNGFL